MYNLLKNYKITHAIIQLKLVTTMSKLFICLGAFNAFISVAAGAFAAHGLKNSLTEDYLATFRTAADYQFYHALGLIIIGILLGIEYKQSTLISGWVMFTGIIIFSGSLYVLALTGTRWLGMITPIGGVCFLISWLTIAVSYLRSSYQ
jgi:uncharacterized membrane protein YgdD (TMEM256/DUF423 family)